MKRMYITLGIILLVFIGALTALGQMASNHLGTEESAPFDRMKRRMELREEMHRRLRDKLLHGIGPGQDIFEDIEKMMEDSMSDSLSIDFMGKSQNHFQSEWLESSSGRILQITPQDKDQKLNIDVNESMITIKGQSQQTSSGSRFSSSFSTSFSVPDDCDGQRVKMTEKDGKILVELPFKSTQKIVSPPPRPKGPERRPLPHSEADITI